MQYLNIKVEKDSWYISEALITCDESSSAEDRKKMAAHNWAAHRMIVAGPFATLKEAEAKCQELDMEVYLWKASSKLVESLCNH